MKTLWLLKLIRTVVNNITERELPGDAKELRFYMIAKRIRSILEEEHIHEN